MEFKKAVEIILKLEGGYHINPKDPGGETNYGISKRAYPDLDIKGLTRSHARHIYEKDYWVALKCLGFPDELRLPMFDCGVNQGVRYAAKTMQRCLKVKADGIIGPKTLAAASHPPEKLLEKFMTKRVERYFRNKNFDTFGRGWINRLVVIMCYNNK